MTISQSTPSYPALARGSRFRMMFAGKRSKTKAWMLLLIVAALSGCASSIREVNSRMDWWIGHHQSELIAAWGPPHQTAPDGAGGTVFVYNFRKDLGQIPGRVYAKGKEVRYTDPERMAWNRIRMFYVNPDGVIYSWRWEGGENLFCSGCGQYRLPQGTVTQVNSVKAASDMGTVDTKVPCDQESQLRSLVSLKQADLTIRNEGSEPLRLYWLDYQGRRKLYANVAPGHFSRQQTFLTHPWVLADSTDACVLIFYGPGTVSFP
jgi:hypothetical protein